MPAKSRKVTARPSAHKPSTKLQPKATTAAKRPPKTSPKAKPAAKSKPLPSAKPRRPEAALARAQRVETPSAAPVVASKKFLVRAGVSAGTRYPVLVGSGLLSGRCPELDEALSSRRAVLLVVDAGLSPAMIEPLIKRVEARGLRWGVCVVRASEDDKSIETLQRVLAEAARLRLERRDAVIALGGGITTDLAGFAASIYRRGIDVIQCPTSLLAMVDAAVGGKTAVNITVPGEHGEGGNKARLLKNMVGAFHPPALVICDVATLATLPQRELRAGLAECFKHALISKALGDANLADFTRKALPDLLNGNQPALAQLVHRNTACKARIVQLDERETSTKPDGGRMMLNLGHTFAHAIETLPGLSWRTASGQLQIGPLKHGEAVGLGLLCAARTAEALKLLKPTTKAALPVSIDLERTLRQADLPTTVAGLPPAETILRRMFDDKKVDAGRLRLILPRTGGLCVVRDDVPAPVILDSIRSIAAPGSI